MTPNRIDIWLNLEIWSSVLVCWGISGYYTYQLNKLRKYREDLQLSYTNLVDEVNDHIREFNNFIATNNYSKEHKLKEGTIH